MTAAPVACDVRTVPDSARSGPHPRGWGMLHALGRSVLENVFPGLSGALDWTPAALLPLRLLSAAVQSVGHFRKQLAQRPAPRQKPRKRAGVAMARVAEETPPAATPPPQDRQPGAFKGAFRQYRLGDRFRKKRILRMNHGHNDER